MSEGKNNSGFYCQVSLSLALGLGALAGPGCLLTGVGENLEQSGCNDEPKSFCDELNQLSPSGDACLEWACDANEGVCKLLPFDEDDDGAPSAACAPAGVIADCDDTDPRRTPIVGETATLESCDGVDNDCDDLIDEGAYTVAVADGTVVSGLVQNFSVSKDSGFVPAFLYSKTEGNAQEARAVLGSDEVSVTIETTGVKIQSSFLQFSGSDRVVALGKTDGAGGLELGTLSSTGVLVSSAFSGEGTGRFSEIRFAVSEDASRFVGSYIDRIVSPIDACGEFAGVAGSTAPARLFTGSMAMGEPLIDAGELALGETADPSPMSVVPITAEQWLVAKANASAVEIHEVTANNASFTAQEAARVEVSSGIPGEVNLALDESQGQVALVYRSGCGTNTKIHLVLLSRTDDDVSIVRSVVLSEAQNARNPAVLWRQSPSPGWIVTWVENNRNAKLAWLTAAGDLVGEPYQLLSEPGLGQGSFLTRAGNNGLEVFIPSSSGEPGVRSVTLSCLSE